MSNEKFFIDLVCDKFVDLLEEKPIIENSLRVYYFRYYYADGTSSIYQIRFNQIGGYIDCMEVDV